MVFRELSITAALFNISLEKSRAFGWCLIISWRVFSCLWDTIHQRNNLPSSTYVHFCWFDFGMFFWCCTLTFSIWIICFPLLIQKCKLLHIIGIIKIQYQEQILCKHASFFNIYEVIFFFGCFYTLYILQFLFSEK